MTMWLKQSTASTVKIGPFVDSGDGNTVEGGLTVSQADIRLSKNGGDIAQTNNAAGATHDELGYYDVPLNTTDTNTLGRLKVMVHETGALPVWADYMVVPANVWDSLFGADQLQVHVNEMTASIITSTVLAADAITAAKVAADVTTEIQTGLATAANLQTLDDFVDTEVAAILAAVDTEVSAIKTVTDALTAAAAVKLALSAGAMVVGNAITGTLSTTQFTTDLTEATNSHFNGRIVMFTSGALTGEVREITAYTGATKLITVATMTDVPANGDDFIIV